MQTFLSGSLTGGFVPLSGRQPVLFLHHHLPVRGPGHLCCRCTLLPHAGDLVSVPLSPHTSCSQSRLPWPVKTCHMVKAPLPVNPSASEGCGAQHLFCTRLSLLSPALPHEHSPHVTYHTGILSFHILTERVSTAQ